MMTDDLHAPPEPGTAAWEAMVVQGARGIYEGTPGSGAPWERLSREVQDELRRDADLALRAALGTGDA